MTFANACEVFCRRETNLFEAAADSVIHAARQGLDDQQIETLCRSIAASGSNVSLPRSLEPFVDVPSSGGPASLTTLLCPLLVATFGFHVPKLSASGSVAGGIDTMGIIPGFNTNLSGARFVAALRRCRFAHAQPSATFCPADTVLVRKRRAARMMANPALATASLLAKKLATPHTRAVFDFRVGAGGNIGENVRTAQSAKRLFERIAEKLKIPVEVVLTENRTFPSSALGRLESLSLLWRALSNDPLLAIDRDHIRLCVDIASIACVLAHETLRLAKVKAKLIKVIESGEVKRVFIAHLYAQGASQRDFARVMESRRSQTTVRICSTSDGYWVPPNVNRCKEWLKNEQKGLTDNILDAEKQLGLRLCRTRGDLVRRGDLVMEFRHPPDAQGTTIPRWLAGRTNKSEPAIRLQSLG